ncbi:MAG: GNAT family N-acetyltransferase [Chloroflexi bacterium]|nr:GNAT family N-acetyltransferase [Chloroflexota bacterium]
MDSGYHVRVLAKSEYNLWDKLVDSSPQGTIFSSSTWLELMAETQEREARVYGCYSGQNLVGGCITLVTQKGPFKKGWVPPLTSYFGVVIQPHESPRISKQESLEGKIMRSLIERLQADFDSIKLSNHSSLIDIRPFLWARWRAETRYTFTADVRDIEAMWRGVDQEARYEINKARKNGVGVCHSDDIRQFSRLVELTFLRQGKAPEPSERLLLHLFDRLSRRGLCRLYLAGETQESANAGALVVWDSKRAYYLMAASDPAIRNGSPSLLLWTILEEMSQNFAEVDLVGANTPSIAKFKKDFASRLVPYYVVEHFSPFFSTLYNSWLLPKGIRGRLA